MSDWDDHLDPDQRSAVMDATRKRLGLEPRGGNFSAGATEGREVHPFGGGMTFAAESASDRKNRESGHPYAWPTGPKSTTLYGHAR